MVSETYATLKSQSMFQYSLVRQNNVQNLICRKWHVQWYIVLFFSQKVEKYEIYFDCF